MQKKGLNILIVEDSDDDVLLALLQFKKAGYQVFYEQVANAEDFSKQLRSGEWDIILSDYSMPNFNGLDALKLLQESAIDIPFIILSGQIGEELAVQVMKAGAQDYIMKNNLIRLVPAIEREIKEHKNREDYRFLLQKQQQAEIIERTSLNLKNLISDMHVGIIVVGGNGEIRMLNNEATELLDLSELQLTGKASISKEWKVQFEDGSTYNKITDVFNKITKSGKLIRNNELHVYRPMKNDWVWLFANSAPQFNEKGKISQVVLTFVDRTARKNAEEALKEREEHYRNLIERSPDAIAIHQEGKIVYVNSAGVNAFGVRHKNELVGKNILSIVHPHYHKLAIDRIEKSLNSVKDLYAEEVFMRTDGSVFNVEVASLPTTFNNKPATHVIVRDITTRKKNEEEIKTKNIELQKLNSEKDKFFSIIAHDLRSPFSSFLGMTQLLAEQINTFPVDKLKTIFQDMHSSAGSLYTLLENLLQWASIQRGTFTYNPDKLNLQELIHASLMSANNTAKEKDITLNSAIPEYLNVYADKNMFQTILRNLVSNALKFTAKGGSIQIQAQQLSSQNVEISVTDTGIGMDEKMVNNLFELNAQTNRPGTEGEASSGLGLILCKEFIEKHKGKIEVKSKVNHGTTFSFILKSV